jgi:hypothetical protein
MNQVPYSQVSTDREEVRRRFSRKSEREIKITELSETK